MIRRSRDMGPLDAFRSLSNRTHLSDGPRILTEGFSPLMEPSMDWWMQAKNSSRTATPVFRWFDDSAQRSHYGKDTSNIPTIVLVNGYTAINFQSGQGADEVDIFNPCSFTAANTMFAVVTKTTGGSEYYWNGNNGQGGPAFITGFSSKDFEYFTHSSGERATFAASADSNPHILALTRTDGSGNYTGYFDGAQVFSNAIVNNSNANWNGNKVAHIGAFAIGSGTANINILELIHCSSVLGTGQLNNFHWYFNRKYRIPVTYN